MLTSLIRGKRRLVYKFRIPPWVLASLWRMRLRWRFALAYRQAYGNDILIEAELDGAAFFNGLS